MQLPQHHHQEGDPHPQVLNFRLAFAGHWEFPTGQSFQSVQVPLGDLLQDFLRHWSETDTPITP